MAKNRHRMTVAGTAAAISLWAGSSLQAEWPKFWRGLKPKTSATRNDSGSFGSPLNRNSRPVPSTLGPRTPHERATAQPRILPARGDLVESPTDAGQPIGSTGSPDE